MIETADMIPQRNQAAIKWREIDIWYFYGDNLALKDGWEEDKKYSTVGSL